MINLYSEKIRNVWFGTACDENEIFATAFAFSEDAILQSLLKNIPYNTPFQHSKKFSTLAEHVMVLLRDIYYGKDVSPSFHLATDRLSSYAKIVVKMISLVPVGHVTFYGSVAEAAGGGPRAVGRVMALNPFPLIVPCHRVVRSDFKLGGYGGGLDVKLEILGRESRGYASERKISVGDKKLLVFPVEFVLKQLEKGKC